MTDTVVMTLNDIVSCLSRGGERVTWLRDALNGKLTKTEGMDYKARHIFYKEHRLYGLPIFFPCGVVKRGKPIEVIEPSNLICMDIDRKDNLFAYFPWLTKMCYKAKSCPSGWDFVSENTARLFNSVCLICASTSGNGVFMLIHYKGNDINDRNIAFDYAVEQLNKIGINADLEAKASAQFRYFSCDQNLYYNPDPVTLEVPDDWKATITTQKPAIVAAPPSVVEHILPQELPKFKASTMKVQKLLENALNYVFATQTDITKSLADWKKLKVSIYCAEYAGVIDNGWDVFWAFSRFYNKGEADQNENKYFYSQPLDRVKIHDFKPATLNGLWSLCRKYGVPYE